MKFALLVTGNLRFESETHFNNFVDACSGCDIFVATYKIYEKLAKKLTNNYSLIICRGIHSSTG